MSSFSNSAVLLVSAFLCLATVWSCTPNVYYPAITNLQRLESDESKILMTILTEESDTFCVEFTLNADSIASSTFGERVACADYSTLDFVYDSSSSQINGISETDGINITRNAATFYIPWDEIPNGEAQSIAADDVKSVELDSLNLLVQIGTYIYCIDFQAANLNTYAVRDVAVYSEDDYQLNMVEVQLYSEYQLIAFVDADDACSRHALFNYTAGWVEDENLFHVNLTEKIESAYNIDLDERTNYAFFWGNSGSFQVFDIDAGSITLLRYGNISTLAPTTSHAVSVSAIINLSFVLTAICCVL